LLLLPLEVREEEEVIGGEFVDELSSAFWLFKSEDPMGPRDCEGLLLLLLLLLEPPLADDEELVCCWFWGKPGGNDGNIFEIYKICDSKEVEKSSFLFLSKSLYRVAIFKR
jgi:hypothetical protein